MTDTLTTAPPVVTPARDAPSGSGGLRTLLSDTLVFAGRNLQHIRQIPEKLLDVTIQPLMFVLLFAYVFGGAIVIVGGNYREYMVAGILVQSMAFGLVGPATSIATDMSEGVVDRFRTLPTNRAAYLLGHYLAEVGGMVLGMVVLLGAGLVVGWRPHNSVPEVVGAMALLLLFASAVVWMGTWIGLLVRSPDAVMGIAFTAVFPLTFLSNAFVPVKSMPNVLQWVASYNPISAVVAAVRELFGNPAAPIAKDVWPMQHPVAAALIYSVILLAAGVPLALHRFRTRTSD